MKIQFLAIPKTAGVSCEKFCQANGIPVHWHHRDMKRWINDYPRLGLTVTVMRDPVDRVISAYQFLKGGGINDLDQRDWATYCAGYPDIDRFIQEGGLERAAREQIHFIPQHLWVCPPMVAYPAGRVHIIDFDNLDAGLANLAEAYGLKYEKIPHLNASKRDGVKLEWRSVDMIRQRYMADIDFKFRHEEKQPSLPL